MSDMIHDTPALVLQPVFTGRRATRVVSPSPFFRSVKICNDYKSNDFSSHPFFFLIFSVLYPDDLKCSVSGSYSFFVVVELIDLMSLKGDGGVERFGSI